MNGLPDRSYVTLCELVTWLAYGKAIDAAVYLARLRAFAAATDRLKRCMADGRRVRGRTLRRRIGKMRHRLARVDVAGVAVVRVIQRGDLTPYLQGGDDYPAPAPNGYFARPIKCDPGHNQFVLDETKTDMEEWVAWRQEPRLKRARISTAQVLAVDWKTLMSDQVRPQPITSQEVASAEARSLVTQSPQQRPPMDAMEGWYRARLDEFLSKHDRWPSQTEDDKAFRKAFAGEKRDTGRQLRAKFRPPEARKGGAGASRKALTKLSAK